jgi:peptidoglycan-associated lipoprotein
MKPASTFSSLILAGAVLALTGCVHKPVRPSPDQTTVGMGPGSTNGSVNPSDVTTNQDLQARDAGAGMGDQIRGQLEPVYFAFDSSTIRPAERPKLQAAKDYLASHPEYRMLLEGHCDWRGTAEYNLALGDRRANEAKKYLVGIGVGADKLDTLSKGSEEATKNADKETAQKDRRVEFVLLKGGGGGSGAPGAAGTPPMP